MRRRLLVVLIGMLAPLVVPGTASAAAPVFHDTFREVLYLPNEDEGPIECRVNNAVVASFSEASSFHANDLVKPVPGSTQAFFGHFNYAFRAEHENLANGETFSVKINGVFKEREAQLLDDTAPFDFPVPRDENGAPIPIIGPVYAFEAIEVAHVMVWDDDGRLVVNDRARILWRAVFDLRGDGEPGGVLISEEEPVILSGSFPFFDFCDLALDLTT